MTFAQGLAFIFRESWAFLRQAWWLAALVTMLQAATGVSRFLPGQWMQVGILTLEGLALLASLALFFVVVRFIALRHDLHAALQVDGDALRTFAPFAAFYIIVNPVWLRVAGYPALLMAVAIAGLVQALAMPLLSLWIVTAPSGGTVIGPRRSAVLALPHFFWSIGMVLVLSVIFSGSLGVLVFILGPSLLNSLADLSPVYVAFAAITGAVSTVSAIATIALYFAVAIRAGLRVDDGAALHEVFE